MLDPTIIDAAKAVNLIELAGQRTELRKKSTHEYEGPCPKCGGTDRFYCTAEWFACRQCHPERGDAIEFTRWDTGLGFVDSVTHITGAATPTEIRQAPRKPVTKLKPATTWNQKKAENEVSRCKRLLFTSSDAEPGRDYLTRRGIEPYAWEAFSLGYAPSCWLPFSGGLTAPAISMPWYRAGQLCAIRYRFLEAQAYTDKDGKERVEKQTAMKDSQFIQRFYGGGQILGCAEDHRTLVLCEGELNAISIWQVAHETNVDVLCVGSESASFSPAMLDYARKFMRVIVWMDRGDVVRKIIPLIGNARGTESPSGKDANDLLQLGKLGAHITVLRWQFAQSVTEREKLLFDLWDHHRSSQGLDDGSRDMMYEMAKKLGKEI